MRQTAGWIGDESSFATANSCCAGMDKSEQSGPGERNTEDALSSGGVVIIRGRSGRGGLGRKAGELPSDPSGSECTCRFWD